MSPPDHYVSQCDYVIRYPVPPTEYSTVWDALAARWVSAVGVAETKINEIHSTVYLKTVYKFGSFHTSSHCTKNATLYNVPHSSKAIGPM